jgi:hypothetical protein
MLEFALIKPLKICHLCTLGQVPAVWVSSVLHPRDSEHLPPGSASGLPPATYGFSGFSLPLCVQSPGHTFTPESTVHSSCPRLATVMTSQALC